MVTMVTILKRILSTLAPCFFMVWEYRRGRFIKSSCRLQRLATFEIVSLSQKSNPLSVSLGTCRIERVPNRDSVHLVTSQVSRFKADQHIGRRLMSVDDYEIAQYVVEHIYCSRACVIWHLFEKILL